MKSLNKPSTIFFVLVLVGAAYYFRQPIETTIDRMRAIHNIASPCERPIEYSLGTFDPQFGMSKKQFQTILAKAEAIWETSADGKDLFKLSETGEVKVNLIYDYRQQATEDMQTLGVVIKNDKVTYDALKDKYSTLVEDYEEAKDVQHGLISQYNSRKDKYEKEVDRWNDRGGAPPNVYKELEAERQELDDMAERINAGTSELNAMADQINSTVNTLNLIAKELNLQVSAFNTIGASTGREFDEGEYIQDAEGTRINIYQYANEDKLIRVLAHELGHVLGLDHIDNPDAIMYRLNESTRKILSPEEIEIVRNMCAN